MQAPTKKTKFITPACVCRWPWLQTPDTKFKPLGEYRVDLIMELDQAKAILAEVKGAVEEQVVKIRNESKYKDWKVAWPIKDDADEDGNNTGKKVLTFKQNAAVVRQDGKKDTYSIHLFDAKKEPLPESVNIGSGTVMKVCFKVRAVASPISKDIRVMFHPLAAQVIQLVAWKSDFGFEEEDGFTSTEHPVIGVGHDPEFDAHVAQQKTAEPSMDDVLAEAGF